MPTTPRPARVATFTVNHQPWIPGFDPPYRVAIVELVEQPGLRLPTNLVNCALDEARIDMPVRVTFEQCDGVWVALFEPERSEGGERARGLDGVERDREGA